MGLPPGPAFVVPILPQLLAPPAAVYAASLLAKRHAGIEIHPFLLGVACVLSWPLAFTIYIVWSNHRDVQNAVAAGAVIPRAVESKYPGGVDLLKLNSKDIEGRFLAYRITEWMKVYGYTFNFRMLFQNRIVTAEPDYIKRILATDFAGYEKGPEFHRQMKSLLGTGVFNADGELWKFHRGMTRPFFSRDRISHFDVFDRHAEAAIERMKSRLQEGYPVDWSDLVARFTLDSATEFLFGQDVRSLSAELPYPPHTPQAVATDADAHPANRFAQAFLAAQEASSRRGRFTNVWPLFEFWENKVDKHVEVMDEFIQPLLKSALAKKEKGGALNDEEAAEEGETLLEQLVKQTDDPRIIRDETLNILLAGRDTTAITLTMAGAMLAQHPHIHRRLREEVLSTVGTRRPTYDDIRNMKYLRAFINEVLRMYPPVPFNVRFTTKPTVWPPIHLGDRPLYIAANTRCMYSVFVMHRRTDLWGPTALQFDPDRFLDERVSKYLTPNPFIFLPFNAGPRICLGQQFAYNEVSFMLIRLLQHVSEFNLRQDANPGAVPPEGWAQSSISDGSDKVLIKSHLTLYVKGGLWVDAKIEESNIED